MKKSRNWILLFFFAPTLAVTQWEFLIEEEFRVSVRVRVREKDRALFFRSRSDTPPLTISYKKRIQRECGSERER
jgi:hypothetical protein